MPQMQHRSDILSRITTYAIAIAIVLGIAFIGNQPLQAQSYSVLYSFTGGADGAYPFAPLVLDFAGNLYGTTEYGGTSQHGAVFKLNTGGTESVVYSFTVSGDGQYPFAGLVWDFAGNLYGTTQYGGAFGNGTVFKVDRNGTETVLYSFTGGADGANPRAHLTRDIAGNLYGTTYYGGSGSCVQGCGVVFKLDKNGNETVLYSFTGGADGSNPSGLIQDWAGNLYGTTSNFGSSGFGTIFKLSKDAKETVLYRFTGSGDGAYPVAPLAFDLVGNLYGTTQYGGVCCGTVFKLTKEGKEIVLYEFTGGQDGAQPLSGLVLDLAGHIYGTTYWGGTANAGTVFQVNENGTESILHSFAGGEDGAYPYAGLAMDIFGNLYGTTQYGGGNSIGGASGFGTVFKLTRPSTIP